MAPLVYTKRLLAVSALTGAAGATVPPGKVWVVKHVAFWINPAVAGDAVVVTGAAGTIIAATQCPTSGGIYQVGQALTQALYAAETMQAVSVGGAWAVAVTGYELSAV